jgi:hypothetical protein
VLWTWIVSGLLLLGGELVSHIQDMLVEEKSQQQAQEHHERRDPTNPKHDQESEKQDQKSET